MAEPLPASVERRFGAGGPSLAETGEVALLDELVAIAVEAAPSSSPASGDDAAVWTPPEHSDLATSVDALVEGVDFRREWITPRQLGRRAFAVAVSDLAGMAASPVLCVATLCARPTEQLEDVLELQRGLCSAAAAAGCAVAGGDVSAIDGPLVLDLCVTGSLPVGRALRRDAGRPGDLLVVTGTLGAAAAGLRLLEDGVTGVDEAERAWMDAQLQPPTRLREGRRLLDLGVRCGGDLSDGLLVDARRTARASGCAAELWAGAIPVPAGLRARFGRDWLQLAAGGGEDFELLAAVPEQDAAALVDSWPDHLAPLTVVGRLGEGSGLRMLDRRGGIEVGIPAATSAHFA